MLSVGRTFETLLLCSPFVNETVNDVGILVAAAWIKRLRSHLFPSLFITRFTFLLQSSLHCYSSFTPTSYVYINTIPVANRQDA